MRPTRIARGAPKLHTRHSCVPRQQAPSERTLKAFVAFVISVAFVPAAAAKWMSQLQISASVRASATVRCDKIFQREGELIGFLAQPGALDVKRCDRIGQLGAWRRRLANRVAVLANP